MSKPPVSEWIGRITSFFSSVTNLYLAVVAIATIVLGQLLPERVKTLIFQLLGLLIIGTFIWQWCAAEREAPLQRVQSLRSGGAKPRRLPRFLWPLWEPAPPEANRVYCHSLKWRRLAGGSLFGLLLLTSFWTLYSLPQIQAEQRNVQFPGLECSSVERLGSASDREPLQIVIATFSVKESEKDLFQEQDLFERLYKQVGGEISICTTEMVVETTLDAQQLGKDVPAAVVIWGSIDAARYKVKIDVTDSEWPDLTLSHQTDGSYTFEFQKQEQEALEFLALFTVSNVYYIQQRPDDARELLARALAKAPDLPDNARELAEAYFFLGQLSEVPLGQPDQQSPELPTAVDPQVLSDAVDAYSRALVYDPTMYEALWNRALAFRKLGEMQPAMDDYTSLTQSGSEWAGDAYIERARLQPTPDLAMQDLQSAIAVSPEQGYIARAEMRLWEWNDPNGAIADYQEALRLNPDEPYRYYELGQAQLIAGQTDAAAQTLRDAGRHLDASEREVFISNLRALSKQYPQARDSIESIVDEMQSASP
jgi:tetratricopeptide (TPR) repeat protein